MALNGFKHLFQKEIWWWKYFQVELWILKRRKMTSFSCFLFVCLFASGIISQTCHFSCPSTCCHPYLSFHDFTYCFEFCLNSWFHLLISYFLCMGQREKLGRHPKLLYTRVSQWCNNENYFPKIITEAYEMLGSEPYHDWYELRDSGLSLSPVVNS